MTTSIDEMLLMTLCTFLGATFVFWWLFRKNWVIPKSKTFLILEEFNGKKYVVHQQKIYLLTEVIL